MKSQHAQVAALIKKELKAYGIKCKAKSSSFSMGNSVHVKVYDQTPETMAKIESAFSKYQYGHFDGMTDMYEYSNTSDDIPQTKYLSISNETSDELHQACWDYIKASISGFDESPDNSQEAYNFWHDNGDNGQWWINRILTEKGGFWTTYKPRRRLAA